MTTDAAPITEIDLSAYVLALLDEHVAAMRAVRDRMRVGGTISPGERYAIALDSVTIAESYAARLTRALHGPETPA
jgi:hypothetical protein